MAEKKFRLITRADFDGVVCGALFNELEMIDDIVFTEPNNMQQEGALFPTRTSALTCRSSRVSTFVWTTTPARSSASARRIT